MTAIEKIILLILTVLLSGTIIAFCYVTIQEIISIIKENKWRKKASPIDYWLDEEFERYK
jgi:hypothetical protein